MMVMFDDVVWIKHYSSEHDILLVGEGDFSFSASLASAFRSAVNIVATSLDSYEELTKKYKNAKANIALLQYYGATLLHGVDATRMKLFPDLQRRRFHRIIYNFPHAGFHRKEDHPDLIAMHRQLVRGFFSNARSMLWTDGEIHVTHKIKAPFKDWKIENLASQCSLLWVGCDDFKIQDFPGYCNKRGAGSRCDEPFLLGECKTFKFQNVPETWNKVDLMHGNLRTPINVPVPIIRQPPLQPVRFIDSNMQNRHTQNTDKRTECLKIFGGYLNHVNETFGNTRYDVYQSVREALRVGFNRYMGAMPGRELGGYIGILEELHQLSIVRSEQLRQMALRLNEQL